MLILITGGSGSGKSEYAESLAMSLGEKRIYIATMMVYDEEGKKRVERHQAMREHKNFLTLERPVNLDSLADSGVAKGAVVLLECMSNLVANEMFSSGDNMPSGDWAADKILHGINLLIGDCSHLVIVTNEVFSDGNTYEPETERYIRVLGTVNVRLAAMADRMTEVICGIPADYPDRTAGR